MREIVWATYFDRVSGSTCCEYITADSILSKDPDERLSCLKERDNLVKSDHILKTTRPAKRNVLHT